MELRPVLALCTVIWFGEVIEVVHSQGKSRTKDDKPKPGWRLIFNPCAVTCGGGYHRSQAMCLLLDVRVEDSECSGEKPVETVQPCGQQPCFTPRWMPFTYSECSVSCGQGGVVLQISKCYIQVGDPSGKLNYTEVAERMCEKRRPTLQQISCAMPACPATIAKVDQASNTCSNPPCPGSDQKGSAERSALQFTMLIGLTSLSAFLIRFYFFDT